MINTLFGPVPLASQDDISNEWYTLAKHIAAAREVLNGIELDPASCAAANKVVQAERYYTLQDDGLKQDWTCKNMWLNPPFGSTNGKSNMALWSQRLINQYEQRIVQQAILLCMANTEGQWFSPLWDYPICFPNPRVLFHRPNGAVDHHVLGTCFVYFGAYPQKFITTFRAFGPVVTPDGVHKAAAKAVPLSLFDAV